MRKAVVVMMAWYGFPSPAAAQSVPPLIEPAVARAIAGEVSGSAAKRQVEALSLNHRMRGSRGYRAAAEHIRDRLRSFGLEEVEIIALPADGKIFYGTQRARPAWNASFAELWERRRDGADWADGERVPPGQTSRSASRKTASTDAPTRN